MKRGWFGPRIVGWGASPASWEGWLITGVMVLALAGAGIAFNDRPTAGSRTCSCSPSMG